MHLSVSWVSWVSCVRCVSCVSCDGAQRCHGSLPPVQHATRNTLMQYVKRITARQAHLFCDDCVDALLARQGQCAIAEDLV